MNISININYMTVRLFCCFVPWVMLVFGSNPDHILYFTLNWDCGRATFAHFASGFQPGIQCCGLCCLEDQARQRPQEKWDAKRSLKENTQNSVWKEATCRRSWDVGCWSAKRRLTLHMRLSLSLRWKWSYFAETDSKYLKISKNIESFCKFDFEATKKE